MSKKKDCVSFVLENIDTQPTTFIAQLTNRWDFLEIV